MAAQCLMSKVKMRYMFYITPKYLLMQRSTKLTPLLSLFFIALTVFSFSHCDSSDPDVMPSNLQMGFTIATDGSGNVTLTATADNTTTFEIDFGVSGKAPRKSITGIENFIYPASGNYTVTVKAIGSKPSLFITKSEAISVEVFFTIPTAGYSTPTTYPDMDAIWADEFDGTALNESDWTFEIGDGCPGNCGWGNNELEYYQKANTTVADGYLVIEAKQQALNGKQYTSSRIITKDKVDIKYGRVDIRAVMPKGQGIWPALWMLGSNINTVGWAKCGEIDILEMIGGNAVGRDGTAYATAHWFADSQSKNVNYGGHKDLATGEKLADQFHVFSIVWDATKITWYLDDVQFHVIDITPAELSEFKEEFFFIMNVAVGGNWPGSPDATTNFPQRMAVDYIRVFQPK